MRKITLLAATVLALQAIPAQAWGPTGHRITGAIAEYYLDDGTREAIAEILGVESVAEASTWSDFMRSDPSDFWQKESPVFHYVTIPDGKTYANEGAPPVGDAITALAKYSAIVKDKDASLVERQLALRFVIHIIQDLHQPLHVGTGSDRGGNDVLVTYKGKQTNLHSVIDYEMIDGELLSHTEWSIWLQRRITPEMQVEWTDLDPMAWLAESVQLRDGLYPAKDARTEVTERSPGGEPVLSYDYVYQHKATLDLRLQQGGVRLAAYLNDLFNQDSDGAVDVDDQREDADEL